PVPAVPPGAGGAAWRGFVPMWCHSPWPEHHIRRGPTSPPSVQQSPGWELEGARHRQQTDRPRGGPPAGPGGGTGGSLSLNRYRAAVSSRLRMSAALRHRDFALLWSGQSVSLVGDGMFIVALAIETLHIDNRPTALSLVLAARLLPMVLLLLVGGAGLARLP